MKTTNIQRLPEIIKIITESGEVSDAKVSFEERKDRLSVFLEANLDKVKFIAMRWKNFQDSPVKVLGDNWERLQSNAGFYPLSCDRFLPWYFIITDGENTDACGVMVRPNSFVSFECDCDGVSGWFDVRCGGNGVDLSGRKFHVADIVSRQYKGVDSFSALKSFCKVLCPDPILPKEPVYGGNNWYYAYGKSSYEEILDDAALQAELAGDNENRPFMVMDDGWQINSCAGPWLPNEKFGDMKKLADEIKKMGVKPGLWVRFLHNLDFEKEHPECLIKKDIGKDTFLDPSHPDVLKLIRDDIERIKSWGYSLIKHDYTSYDIFNEFGYIYNGSVNEHEGWSFYDTKKTSAEIVLNLYKTIYEACGEDMLIIGCNTFSHLSAGLLQINRIGDDTSGRNWDRTRAYGINSLAFRLPQHNAFYAIDADCAGFMDNKIPWELNSQWVDLLAKSGTPLFISCPNHLLDAEQIEFMKKAYAINSKLQDEAIPLDWEYNITPGRWLISGEEKVYNWNTDNIPRLLHWCFNQPLY